MNKKVYKFVSVFFYFLLQWRKSHSHSDSPSTYNIGGVLSDAESEEHFITTIKVSFLLQ